MNARASSKSGRLVSSLLLSHRCGSARSSWVQRPFLVSGGNHSVSARLLPRYHYSDRRHGFRARGRSELGLPLLATFGSIGFLITPDQKSHEHDAAAAEERILHSSRSRQQEDMTNSYLLTTLRQLRNWLHIHIYETIATGFRFLHLVLVFVPVIATVPAIWIGRRVKDRSNEPVGRLWWYGLLVYSMESAGATFIKLGQWAASRTDIFPPELCNLMSTLHSNAPSHPFAVTREIICRAFNGHSFDDIFEEFDEQPLGVGAIAQVYKAKLRPGFAVPRDDIEDMHDISSQVKRNVGLLVNKIPPVMAPSSYVAVKVLHPGIEKTVERDLCIMNFFAKLINMIPTMEWLSFPDEVKQFGSMMRLQLNLKTEASHLSTFRDKFKGRTTAYFPYPYEQYTTREVLVEEFAQGIPLATFLKNGAGAYHKEIAHEGLDAFLHMLLIDNFIHSDLHPGNIMVRFYKPHQLRLFLQMQETKHESHMKTLDDESKFVLSRLLPVQDNPEAWNQNLEVIRSEGYKPQIVFIDTGLVTKLNTINRKNFLALFQAIAEFDGYKAGTLMVERSRQPYAVIDPEIFALRMQNLALDLKRRTFALGNVEIGDVLGQVLSMVRKHHVRLEGDFVNVVISCLLLEGIGRNLDPELDLFNSALPILRQLGSEGSLLDSVRQGDTSMLRVWLGMEARAYVQASVDSVENCVKYDLLSPNI